MPQKGCIKSRTKTHVVVCDYCNITFVTRGSKARYCSKKCWRRGYRAENPELIRKGDIKWKTNNPNKCKQYIHDRRREKHSKVRQEEQNYNIRLRFAFFEMYGHSCQCCGETRIEFLTLDHVLNDGNKERRERGHKGTMSTYRKAIKEYRPDLYQPLCMNCNCAKSRYGQCPHEKERHSSQENTVAERLVDIANQ